MKLKTKFKPEARLSDKIKIAHVVDYVMPTMGYQEYLLPKWNAKHGHDVHIIASDRYYPVLNYTETWGKFLGPRNCGKGLQQTEGITIHRLPCTWEWKARPWLIGLEQTIKHLRPDIIFCHGSASITSFRVAILAKRIGVPLFMDNHMIHVAKNRSTVGNAYYFVLKIASRVILNKSVYRFFGVAQECCDFLEHEQGIPADKIDGLPLGVDTELFSVKKSAKEYLRKELQVPLEAKVILQTGKLCPEKGPHLLAQAVAGIMKNRSNVWLVLVGSGLGSYIEKVRLPLKECGVEDRLVISPFVEASHLAEIYSMADICVYPLGTSLSCLEAAACGCAVIMTDLPASQWRAESGTGICYKTGDPIDLERRIEELLSTPERIKEMGHRASASVINSFSYDAIAKRSEKFMLKAIDKNRRGA